MLSQYPVKFPDDLKTNHKNDLLLRAEISRHSLKENNVY